MQRVDKRYLLPNSQSLTWGIKLTPAQCRIGPPGHPGWRAGTTTTNLGHAGTTNLANGAQKTLNFGCFQKKIFKKLFGKVARHSANVVLQPTKIASMLVNLTYCQRRRDVGNRTLVHQNSAAFITFCGSATVSKKVFPCYARSGKHLFPGARAAGSIQGARETGSKNPPHYCLGDTDTVCTLSAQTANQGLGNFCK